MLRLFVDGNLINDGADNQYPQGESMGRWSYGTQVSVRTFPVTELKA